MYNFRQNKSVTICLKNLVCDRINQTFIKGIVKTRGETSR